MAEERRRLGRGLAALLGEAGTEAPVTRSRGQRRVPIEFLRPNPNNPRTQFREADLADLTASIREKGIIQPIIVRSTGSENSYEIIAGERRWRACQQLGMSQVPVLIRQVNDETAIALALIENLQREDLSAMDQARAMQRLLTDFGLSHQQIAEILSKSRAAVSNHLRLLNLSTEVQAFLEQGSLDMGHARSLLTLTDKEQKRIANLVVAKGLSVRETERLVNAAKATKANPKKPRVAYSEILQSQINKLGQHLHTDVRVKAVEAERGTIVIHYADLTALDKIITKILG